MTPRPFSVGEPVVSKNWGIAPLPLFELANVFVRFDHVASAIVNADHSVVC
jgi:hypothetical protein